MRTLKRGTTTAGLILLLAGASAFAEQPPGGPSEQGPGDPPAPPPAMRGTGMRMRPGGPMQPGRPPMERAMGHLLISPPMMEKLGITDDQKKKIEDIWQQHRLKLVDLEATVRKAEITMEPLMSAEQPDEAKILSQIDKVAQARAELEKGNARMLLGIRQVLTPEQWKKLQQERPANAPGMGMGMGMGRGPRMRGAGGGPGNPPPAAAPKAQQD